MPQPVGRPATKCRRPIRQRVPDSVFTPPVGMKATREDGPRPRSERRPEEVTSGDALAGGAPAIVAMTLEDGLTNVPARLSTGAVSAARPHAHRRRAGRLPFRRGPAPARIRPPSLTARLKLGCVAGGDLSVPRLSVRPPLQRDSRHVMVEVLESDGVRRRRVELGQTRTPLVPDANERSVLSTAPV